MKFINKKFTLIFINTYWYFNSLFLSVDNNITVTNLLFIFLEILPGIKFLTYHKDIFNLFKIILRLIIMLEKTLKIMSLCKYGA